MLLQFIIWAKATHNIKPCILLLYGGYLEPEFKSLGPTFNLSAHAGNATFSEKIIGKYSLAKKKDRYFLRILNEIKKHQPRICYANTIVSAAVLPAIKEVLQISVLLHVHEMAFSATTFYHQYLKQNYFEVPAKFIAVSEEVKSFLTGQMNVPAGKVTVIPPFIADQFINTVTSAKPLNRAKFTVGFSGFGGWRKGIGLMPVLIKEVDKIKPVSADVSFLWVGNIPGIEQQQLSYLLGMLGLSESLIVTGHVDDPSVYYQQMDAFVLLSVEDPYPLVCMEAACFELPVLCFDKCGGAADFVSGECGIAVSFIDIPAMAAAIVNLIEDRDLSNRIGTNARIKAQRYSIDKTAPKMWQELGQLFPA